MPHGPVLSTALDLANDNALVDEYSLWYATIERKDNIALALRSEPAQEDYDELSASDMEILKKTVQEFGAKWLIGLSRRTAQAHRVLFERSTIVILTPSPSTPYT